MLDHYPSEIIMSTNLDTMTPRSTSLTENHDRAIMNALRDSFYPGAREDSILMVLNYCKAAGLDPMTRPVHIVPMNVKKPGTRDYEWRDVVMPGIEFYRTKADRTGRYAGQDDDEFGPEVHNDAWGISYPLWCKTTVYKITEVGRVPYSAKVFWMEAYATKGKDSTAPNAMWSKRPYGQLSKCSEAAALRKAFPEVGGQQTADEMYGKTVEHGPIEDVPQKQEKPPYPDSRLADSFPAWLERIKSGATTMDAIINMIETKYTLTDEQKQAMQEAVQPPADNADWFEGEAA